MRTRWLFSDILLSFLLLSSEDNAVLYSRPLSDALVILAMEADYRNNTMDFQQNRIKPEKFNSIMHIQTLFYCDVTAQQKHITLR